MYSPSPIKNSQRHTKKQKDYITPMTNLPVDYYHCPQLQALPVFVLLSPVRSQAVLADTAAVLAVLAVVAVL